MTREWTAEERLSAALGSSTWHPTHDLDADTHIAIKEGLAEIGRLRAEVAGLRETLAALTPNTTIQLCGKEGPFLAVCTRPVGHDGRHAGPSGRWQTKRQPSLRERGDAMKPNEVEVGEVYEAKDSASGRWWPVVVLGKHNRPRIEFLTRLATDKFASMEWHTAGQLRRQKPAQ